MALEYSNGINKARPQEFVLYIALFLIDQLEAGPKFGPEFQPDFPNTATVLHKRHT